MFTVYLYITVLQSHCCPMPSGSGLGYLPPCARGSTSYLSVNCGSLTLNLNANSNTPTPWHSASNVPAILQGFWPFELKDLADGTCQLDRSQNRQPQRLLTHSQPVWHTTEVTTTRGVNNPKTRRNGGLFLMLARGNGGDARGKQWPTLRPKLTDSAFPIPCRMG